MPDPGELNKAHQLVFDKLYNSVAGHFDANGNIIAETALPEMFGLRTELVQYGYPVETVNTIGLLAMRVAKQRAKQLVDLREGAGGINYPEDIL